MAIAEGGGSRGRKEERCQSLSALVRGIRSTNRQIALSSHMTNFDGCMTFRKSVSWLA